MPITPRNLLTCLVAIAAIAGCSGMRSVPAAPLARSEPQHAAAPVPAPKSAAWTVNGYKHDVADSIYRANPNDLYVGAPPPVLKSIVVLSIVVDAAGRPSRVAVMRSNGYTELERVAVRSVERASPLPRPGLLLARGGTVEFTETWLFRDDGRFQLRSLAQVQATTED